MNNETLHLLGVNHHQTGVDLYIGTEDELCDIATAGNNEVFEVAPEEQADPDSPWPEGPGWYYAIGDRDYVKVDTRFEAIAGILQHDGHPLSFTVDRAKEILRLADAGEPTGMWHHNHFKVVAAIRRCLEERDLIVTPERIVEAVVSASREDDLLIHWGENGRFEAFRDLEQDDPDYTEEDLLRAAKNLLSTDHDRPIETVEDALRNIGSI